MNLLERLNKKDWSPTSYQITTEKLKSLLSTDRLNKLFCWHNWIYWTYGEATRKHRVCSKCFKKEKNADVLNKWNRWIKE